MCCAVTDKIAGNQAEEFQRMRLPPCADGEQLWHQSRAYLGVGGCHYGRDMQAVVDVDGDRRPRSPDKVPCRQRLFRRYDG